MLAFAAFDTETIDVFPLLLMFVAAVKPFAPAVRTPVRPELATFVVAVKPFKPIVRTPVRPELANDVLLNRFSRGTIQTECDQIPKPIKMGHVYITSNGGENSQIKPKHIYHAVVAGESRLVNEEDIKTSVRKSLLLADQNNAANIVFIPCDCGTHDINDTARVQLASIKTYLQSNKESKLKNIFIVMEDEESFNTFEEYYNRIF